MELVDNPYPGLYNIRYTSTHGVGESTVRIYGTTHCGLTFEATRVMQVVAPLPTATVSSTPGALCGANVAVTFTATWSDTGETFTTNEYTYTRLVNWSQYICVYGVTDATGTPGITNNWVLAKARTCASSPAKARRRS